AAAAAAAARGDLGPQFTIVKWNAPQKLSSLIDVKGFGCVSTSKYSVVPTRFWLFGIVSRWQISLLGPKSSLRISSSGSPTCAVRFSGGPDCVGPARVEI